MKNLLPLFFALGVFLTSCNNDALDLPDDGIFNLTHQETKTVTDNGLRITFLKIVEDSRCPSEINCDWEGQALVQIRSQKDGEQIEFVLSSAASSILAIVPPNSIQTFGHQVTLLAVNPYPTLANAAAPEDHEIEIEVE